MSHVGAGTSQDVTIIAMGFICAGPGDFCVTYISDYEVGISWERGEGVDNTMVRAAIGRCPEDRDDGYEVYYGNGSTTKDWVNMETLSEEICYVAWTQNDLGVWNDLDTGTGTVEGIGMVLIALISLSLGLLVISFWQKRIWLFISGGIAWFSLGMYGVIKGDSGEVLWIIGILGVMVAFVCFLAPLGMRIRTESGEATLSPDDAYERELEEEARERWERRRQRRARY